MSFPIEKYRFVVADNKVIALSTYAGKTVRGVAICSPEDIFDLEYGKRLAAARCNEKVCAKRRLRAAKKRIEAEYNFILAREQLRKMSNYYSDALEEHHKAMEEEANIEFELGFIDEEDED